MGGASFWLRWSLRDLRDRWLQVAAIALVLGIGTGLFTALNSLATWRNDSNDASFAKLNAHDLRFSLASGNYARRGALARAARSIGDAGSIEAVGERLVVPTQIDASPAGRPVLTPGRIVGVPLNAGQPAIDGISASKGRGLRPADAGRDTAVLELTYAKYHKLPPRGRLRIAGGRSIDYVGLGTSPDYFVVIAPGASFGSEANFGVLFASLATAQRLTGNPGAVNELVVTLKPGASAEVVTTEIKRALARRVPGVAPTVTRKGEETPYRILYRDAENDQRTYNVFALLVLAGASLAAFNLAGRVVEAQRRQIGIGMALGATPARLALRPLLMGAEIAVLGVGFGVGAGLLVGEAMRSLLADQLPLPVIKTPFVGSVFAQGASIGFLLPFAATAFPVWRGLRMTPIEAIQIGFRAAKGSGLAGLARRMPLSSHVVGQMPLRNVLRTPRRTLMTLLGIGAVLTVVFSFAGMIDAFSASLDRSEKETLRGSPERLTVDLDGFFGDRSTIVRKIETAPTVAAAAPVVKLAAKLGANGKRIDAFIEAIDPRSRIWHPSVTAGSFGPGAPGILISSKAADDLKVGPGDTLNVVLPRRIVGTAFRTVTIPERVAGIHPNPLRFLAYVDQGQARLAGLGGVTNTLWVTPKPGMTHEEVQRDLFRRPGVAAVEPSAAGVQTLKKRIDDFTGFILVSEIATLMLAVLIAFNSASINADERSREYATMFAFGMPVRTAVRLAVEESLLTGIAGTAVGIGVGLVVVQWMLKSLISQTLPDLELSVSIAAQTLLTVALLGIVVVALAPLLTARRLRRIDIPATLRVVE